MSVACRAGALFVLVSLAVGQDAPAFQREYLPLDVRELARRRVALTLVQASDTTWFGKILSIPTAGTGGVSIAPDESAGRETTLVVRGRDTAGHPWTIAVPFFGLGTSVWRHDLDRDGIEDLLLAGYTGGNGFAPTMIVTTVMFDRSGRPIPWAVDGYFEQDGRGLKDLVDLDGNGRVELARMAYDDGYWITSLFQAQDGHWKQVSGAHAGRAFPLYTRFTKRPNREAVSPAAGRSPREDRLGNTDLDETPVKIKTLRSWPAGNEDPLFELSDGRQCAFDRWYATASLVLDAPSGRSAAILGADKQARALAERAVRESLPVVVTGKRRYKGTLEHPPSCVPELLWIRGASGKGPRP